MTGQEQNFSGLRATRGAADHATLIEVRGDLYVLAIVNLMVQYPTSVDRAFAALADPTRRALERLGAWRRVPASESPTKNLAGRHRGSLVRDFDHALTRNERLTGLAKR